MDDLLKHLKNPWIGVGTGILLVVLAEKWLGTNATGIPSALKAKFSR